MIPEKKWFEEWFDSPWYYVLYANRNHTEAENFVRNIARLLALKAGEKALDVACGKGRHAKIVAEFGLEVTGTDLSHHSIAEAKKSETDLLHFAVWDMRQVYCESYFDYVFNMFSSFGYFDNEADNEAALKAMHDNLKPGGTLLLDYINCQYAIAHLEKRQIVPRPQAQFHISKRVENGFIKKRIDFLVDGELNSFEEQLKIINRTKFIEMLGNAGLTVEQTLGDYGLHPFNPHTSPRLILIAKRND